jgi:hypothetical protein
MSRPTKKKKDSPKALFDAADSAIEALQKSEKKDLSSTTGALQFVIDQATGNADKNAPRLAFTEQPNQPDNYAGFYKSKKQLLPDSLLKQIRITDHLVAAILRARGNMMALFGHLRRDRFDIGLEIGIRPEILKVLTPNQYTKVKTRMKRFEQQLLNCGETEGIENQDQMTLATYLNVQTNNGLTFGRFATEVIYDREKKNPDGSFPFHRFRPVDTATIRRAIRKQDQHASEGDSLRKQAIQALETITGVKMEIDPAKVNEDKYAWVQVIDEQPRQAFTHDEMLVYNLYESTDVEHNGYPVSPLDTVVNAVTTHISIDAYEKLYFQNGRASKGMLVIKSDEVDESVLNTIKGQFNASINSVSNSFRTPIFGIGQNDDVQWLPFNDEGLHDSAFQYLYDQMARNILSAFNMSPDELPGYAHLSKGTNSQTLSESNNEFKLTASRDTGLRPLVLSFQTFFNQRLFPIMDPLLAKICTVTFAGLDAQSKEQESTRLQQDSALHYTYDELLHEVGKDTVGETVGGKFPFSERFQLILDKYVDVGEIRSRFFGTPASALDPLLKYKRDPFALQNMQLLAQANPAALQAYYAPRPFAIDFLKMEVKDMLEDDED